MLSPSAKLLLSKHPELCKEIVNEYHLMNYATGFKLNISLCWTDFVQKHSEPKRDWEIVEYFHCIETDKHSSTGECGCPIKSVKRLSDNEVFTVGETIQHRTDFYTTVISKFVISNTEPQLMWFNFDGDFEHVRDLKNFVKSKPVLFTTEDGMEVKVGDVVWFVENYKPFDTIVVFHNGRFHDTTDIAKKLPSFSTKEKADEWILLNKPCLSVQDIANVYGFGMTLDFLLNKLEELAKQKRTHA